MELFTDGREAFPQHVAPFPDLTAMIESPDDSIMGDYRPNLPPQKLRPIRSNGRSPVSSHAEDPSVFPEAVELTANGDSRPYWEHPPVKPEAGDVVGTGGGSAEGPPSSELGEELFGSSSDSGDSDLLETVNKSSNKKRKRKRRKKTELFLEKLVMKVMDKQEEMHKLLMETIEKRERERRTREEAWKQQELERIKRDEEARAQETARNVALISFIQNALGHEIEMPLQSTTVSCMEEIGGKDISEDHVQKDVINPVDPIYRWQEGMMQANGAGNNVDNKDTGINSDPNNKRWPDAEVQALIMLRSAWENKLHASGSKCSIWDEISVGMYNMGYCRSAKKCKEKWENINKYFRKSMSSGKKHLENSKKCAYFRDLEILYKSGFGSLANHVNDTKVENENNGESMKGSEC